MAPVKGFVLFLMIGFLRAVFGDKHSLLYLYTMQSKNSTIYDCTAETLLNNRQIDFYCSSDNPRTPKQNWLKNISESDWNKITEKQDDRQLLNKLIVTQMDEFRHLHSDGHVLQWRHGCEGEQSSDGSLTVLNSINEFGFDGEDLIQFNCTSKTCITPEKNREREKKWSKIFFAVNKCVQCEEMLKIYLKYNISDITQSHTPPDVHIFIKKSVQDSSKRILTCMATGFYPKDVKMSLRKFTTEIPERLITSSGVRPNDDETYQLRKSVEMTENDKTQYSCYVSHSSLTEPVIKQRGVFPNQINLRLILGVVLGTLLVMVLCYVIISVLIKKCARREAELRKHVIFVSDPVAYETLSRKVSGLTAPDEYDPFYSAVSAPDKVTQFTPAVSDPDKCTPFRSTDSDSAYWSTLHSTGSSKGAEMHY